MRKKVLAGAIAIAVAATLAGCTGGGAAPGQAGGTPSTLQTVLDRGYLIVGTGSTNVPWEFKNDAGELEGFDVEMARILAQGLFDDPTKVEFVEQAPDARIPNLLTNKVDITIQAMSIAPNRLQQVTFSVPYYTEGIGLILNASGTYKSYDDLEDAIAAGTEVKIAVLQNVDSEATVESILPGAKADQYADQGLLYQALDSKRADAVAIDLSSIRWLASKNPDKYIDSGFAYSPINYGMAMRQDDQIWINFVDGVLEDAMTGYTYLSYKTAFEKYFGGDLDIPGFGKPGIYQ